MDQQTKDMIEREQKENDIALLQARLTNKNVTFIAKDGCEVTVSPQGYVFYNAADWW